MPALTDRSFFLIVSRHNGRLFVDERVERSRAETVDDIRSGQVENVEQVIEFNPREGWSRDVSEDVAREIGQHAFENNYKLRPELHDLVEDKCGIAFADGLRDEPTFEVA